MPVKVLVVDDSGFFRRRISEILDADAGIEVVGSAENGEEAIRKVKELDPDVVTMDIEMPVMDGITAVRRIMAENPSAGTDVLESHHRGSPGDPGCAGGGGSRFSAETLQ